MDEIRESNINMTISTVKDGNMSFLYDDKKKVLANRRKFLKKIGLKLEECTTIRLEQKDNILQVDKTMAGKGMTELDTASYADAMITNEQDIALFLMVADCLVLVVHDPVQEVLALVHLGWMGTELKLANRVIKTMAEKFNSKPMDLIVMMSPAIHGENYKFQNPPQLDLPGWESYLNKGEDGLYGVDFVGYAKDQLIEAGVLEENIKPSTIDTFSDKNYFSHRRSSLTGDKEGRFAVVASLGLK